MTKILVVIVFTLLIPSYLCGQIFTESNEYKLTKFEYSDLEKMQNNSDGYLPIFIKNKNGESLKKLLIFAETYQNDAVVEQCENVKLDNIESIIRVQIFQCTSLCASSIYYWLINKKGEWIELPVIQNEIHEFGMKYKDYAFSKNEMNGIELMEYKDELIQEGIAQSSKVNRVSEKIIKSLNWNGIKILGI
jgi:hypothetical protein